MSLQDDAKKILPFVQAMAEGKTVQYKNRSGRFNNVEVIKDLLSLHPMTSDFINDVDSTLRIKPEPRYRPYTREEWEGVHRVRLIGCDSRYSCLVEQIAGDSVKVDGKWFPFSKTVDLLTNLDGSPCGVEE